MVSAGHGYYMKRRGISDNQVPSNCSWVLRAMFKHKEKLLNTNICRQMQQTDKFPTVKMYKELRGDFDNMCWRKLFDNIARPRALFMLWMGRQGRM